MKRTVVIPEKLDKQFRAEVARRLGYEKGNISKAIVEAIKLWLNKDE